MIDNNSKQKKNKVKAREKRKNGGNNNNDKEKSVDNIHAIIYTYIVCVLKFCDILRFRVFFALTKFTMRNSNNMNQDSLDNNRFEALFYPFTLVASLYSVDNHDDNDDGNSF